MKNYMHLHFQIFNVPKLLPLQSRTIRRLLYMDKTDQYDLQWFCEFLLKQNSYHIFQSFQIINPLDLILNQQFQEALAQISSQNQIYLIFQEQYFPILFKLFLRDYSNALLTIITNFIFDCPEVIFSVKLELEQLNLEQIPPDNIVLIFYYISRTKNYCIEVKQILERWVEHIRYVDLSQYSEGLVAKIIKNLKGIVQNIENMK